MPAVSSLKTISRKYPTSSKKTSGLLFPTTPANSTPISLSTGLSKRTPKSHKSPNTFKRLSSIVTTKLKKLAC